MIVDSSLTVINSVSFTWSNGQMKFVIVGASSLTVTQAKSPEHVVPGSLLSREDVREWQLVLLRSFAGGMHGRLERERWRKR